MRSLARNIKGFLPIKTEILLNSLPQFCEPAKYEKIFQNHISNKRILNQDNNWEWLVFPFSTFKAFPLSTVERLIKYSYNTLKGEETFKLKEYNALLKTCLVNHCDIEVKSILQEMKQKEVQPDYMTFRHLVEIYSQRGDMISTLNVLKVMKAKEFHITEALQRYVYSGFLKAGKLEEAQQYLKDENMDENDAFLLMEKAKVYSEMGQLQNFNNTIDLIKTIDKNLPSTNWHKFYVSFAKGGVLSQSLSQMIDRELLHTLPNLIFKLNRNGLYHHSMKVLSTWVSFINTRSNVTERRLCTEIISSFNVDSCPINTYKYAIELLVSKIVNHYLHLFDNMDFEMAYSFSKSIMQTNNYNVLISNLVSKAFANKSLEHIKASLLFGVSCVPDKDLNIIIQFTFIPQLLRSEYLTKVDLILDLLPQYKDNIVMGLLMHYLSLGNFAYYHSLLDQYPIGHNHYMKYTASNVRNVGNNIPFANLPKLKAEALKAFHPAFVNWFLGAIIVDKLKQINSNNRTEDVAAVVAMSKELDIVLNKQTFFYIKDNLGQFEEHFAQFVKNSEVYSSVEEEGEEVDDEHEMKKEE